MRTLNQTPETDNEVIWIIRIDMDGDYFYFQTSKQINESKKYLTLSGITFSGEIILYDSISEVSKEIDVSLGGGIGSVGNFEFSLSRYTSYTNGIAVYDDFFNSFYPATGKPILTGKTIELGVVWEGATLSTQITWLEQYFIERYQYDVSQIRLSCIDYDELEAKQLPNYLIQKEHTDGISYFSKPPDSNLGIPIPILYGEYNTNTTYGVFKLAPAIRTTKDYFHFVASSHKLESIPVVPFILRYIEKADAVMGIFAVGATNSNEQKGFRTVLNLGERIVGSINIQGNSNTLNNTPDSWVYTAGGADFENIFDKDPVTYATLAPDREMAIKFDYQLATIDIGSLVLDNALDASFTLEWDAIGGNVDLTLWLYNDSGYVNPVGSVSVSSSGSNNTTLYDIAGLLSGKTIEEIQTYQMQIQNKNTSTGTMNIKNAYWSFINITVYSDSSKRRGLAGTALRNTGGRIAPTTITNNIKDGESYLAYCTGRAFGGWNG